MSADTTFPDRPDDTPAPAGDLAIQRTGPRLLRDTPVLDVLDRMSADLTRLRRLTPGSDARHTLEEYFRQLSTAIREGLEADVWISSEEAANRRECSIQAIGYLCRNKLVTARKSGGVWEIHKDSVIPRKRRRAS